MKISIVTPSFQQGQFIERTIQSVLTQSVPVFEYVVIDGGSKDETLRVLGCYADKLRYVSEPDHGQAHAVNKGFRMTSGEIIGWLNSDDIYLPGALQKILTLFERHPEVEVIYGDAYHIDQDDQIIERYPTEAWDIHRLKQTCYLSQPAVFFRREILTKYGLLDESLHFCMDYEYWLRLALHGVRFYYLADVLAGSRLYPDTKTLRSPAKATREAVQMLKKKLGCVPRRWLVNDAAAIVKQKTNLNRETSRFKLATLLLCIIGFFRWNTKNTLCYSHGKQDGVKR